MIIYYKESNKTPSEGDIKILKNKEVFIRAQMISQGCYVVSYGKPSYQWYNDTSERVARYKKAYDEKGLSLFRSSSKSKKTKTRKLRLDMSKEDDRLRYEKLTGMPIEKDTVLTSITLDIKVSE